MASLLRPITVQLPEHDTWIKKLDLETFRKDVDELGKTLKKSIGEEDAVHLRNIVAFTNGVSIAGVALAWLPVWTLLPAILLSTGLFARWTMIGHHSSHGGYDSCKTLPGHNRFTFAVGSLWRRAMDWFDWMLPEAWDIEHNHLHHYALNEDADPDLVERNLEGLRDQPIPVFVKYIIVGFMAMTWKWFYYAPNTFVQLKVAELRDQGRDAEYEAMKKNMPCTLGFMAMQRPALFWECIIRVVGPYFMYRFVLLPLPVLLVGRTVAGAEFGLWAYQNAVLNMLLADVLTNIHSFVMIVTNHAGEDMYRYTDHCLPRSGLFYLRAIISSANFSGGCDIVDFLHGWLNYQIEHHMWPSLSMLQYQKAAPLVQALCKRHGIPYVKENVLIRLKKTVDVMVGNTSSRVFPA